MFPDGSLYQLATIAAPPNRAAAPTIPVGRAATPELELLELPPLPPVGLLVPLLTGVYPEATFGVVAAKALNVVDGAGMADVRAPRDAELAPGN